MKQIKQETGRSMVEMLGVLAVIGVLSVGGISGYTLAMNKHRANSVAADLMKRAVVISAQRQLGQTASLNGFNNQVGDYTTDNQVGTATEGKFSMTVQAVPKEVCEKILALNWDNATISPDTAEGCNGGDMTFTYNNDLSPVTGCSEEGYEFNPETNQCESICDENMYYNSDTKKCESRCSEPFVWNSASGKCCYESTCCDSDQISFCSSKDTRTEECESYECANRTDVISFWAALPTDKSYRIACSAVETPYCTYAIPLDPNPRPCYEIGCCAGEVDDARTTETKGTDGAYVGSCDGIIPW